MNIIYIDVEIRILIKLEPSGHECVRVVIRSIPSTLICVSAISRRVWRHWSRTSATGRRRIEAGTGPPGEKQRGKQGEACHDKGALCPLGPVARRTGRPHAGRYRSRPSPQFSFRCLHARCAALAGRAHTARGNADLRALRP